MKTNVSTARCSNSNTRSLSLIILLSLLCMLHFPANAQQQSEKYFSTSNEVNTSTDKAPEYPGGIMAMNEYIYANQQYPANALKEKIQGRVMAQFIVNTDGSLTDIKIIGSLHPSLDAEAMRLIKNMPRWSPAIYKGQVTQLEYAVPITFKLPPT